MRSYHFFKVETFSILDELEKNGVFKLQAQLSIEGGDDKATPLTTISLINDEYYRGFSKFIIHHEKVNRRTGRPIGEDIIFNSFIEKKSLNGYYNKEESLLLIEGNKASINDFIKKAMKTTSEQIKLSREEVDFPHFIRYVGNVWGGWLSDFNDGNLRSVALYGNQVNLSDDYTRFEAAGQLSSLNCSIIFEHAEYDFMVTKNKTVVIMQNEPIEKDIDLLMHIKPLLNKEKVSERTNAE